jgi:uncharacterized protein (TIGR04255 family)
MTATSLPKRLQKEPLIDAIFEVRFTPAVPAMPVSSVLPGLFFSRIDGEVRIERLAVAELPAQFRALNPEMRFQPLLRLHLDGYSIAVGDENVSLACKLPYRGWNSFKQQIIDTFKILMSSTVVGKIERYSMRYVNIIESIGEGARRINLDITLGKRTLEKEPFNFRVDIPRDDFQQVINLGFPANANLVDGTSRHGVLVDIDVSCNVVPSDLPSNLPDKLEKIHNACKDTFYECVTTDAVEYLGPIYD